MFLGFKILFLVLQAGRRDETAGGCNKKGATRWVDEWVGSRVFLLFTVFIYLNSSAPVKIYILNNHENKESQ